LGSPLPRRGFGPGLAVLGGGYPLPGRGFGGSPGGRSEPVPGTPGIPIPGSAKPPPNRYSPDPPNRGFGRNPGNSRIRRFGTFQEIADFLKSAKSGTSGNRSFPPSKPRVWRFPRRVPNRTFQGLAEPLKSALPGPRPGWGYPLLGGGKPEVSPQVRQTGQTRNMAAGTIGATHVKKRPNSATMRQIEKQRGKSAL
jgi:hypothetical protein